MINYIERTDMSNIAIVAPYIQYGTNEIRNEISKKVDWVINSGEILNLTLLHKKNICFDESYFLDRLDRDFCKQVRRQNLDIIQVENTVLIQVLGEIKAGRRSHSPNRNYYMFRNRFYYNHKFYSFSKRIVLNMLQTTKHITYICKNKDNVRDNMRMLKRAIIDYCNGNMGKLSD